MRKPTNCKHPLKVKWSVVAIWAIGALLPGNTSSSASAQDGPAPGTSVNVSAPASLAITSKQKPPLKLGKSHFIEFRARSAQSYGHTFSVFGKLTAQGKVAAKEVAGLHPATESPIPWMIGHFILVPSETGASDGDNEDQYVTARFRVALTEPEYKKVTDYIKILRGKSPVWHAVWYNCNAFVGDIAHFMGLNTPTSTMLMPEEYIDKLRDLNVSRTDLAGVIGTPAKVENAAELRAVALREIEVRNKSAGKPGMPPIPNPAMPTTHDSF